MEVTGRPTDKFSPSRVSSERLLSALSAQDPILYQITSRIKELAAFGDKLASIALENGMPQAAAQRSHGILPRR